MIARKIADQMGRGSMIRKMFEEGNRLKALYGADQVYDFSLGNPDLEPPRAVQEALCRLVLDKRPGLHSYMSNAGHESVRQAVAARYSRLSGLPVTAGQVCMTVGAAGALNSVLKALLDPGDEVILLAPFFFEYLSYIDNHGGVAVEVPCDRDTLLPAAIRRPNAENQGDHHQFANNRPRDLSLMAAARARRPAAKQDHVITVLSDEPYAELAYDGNIVPSTLACLSQVVVCTSWSKTLSLPGERIGCLIVSPRCQESDRLIQAAVYCNRVLGYVNAPALFQRVIEEAIDAKVDISLYEKRRDMLAEVLLAAGFNLQKPQGGLYLFPHSPCDDDVAFAAACARHRVLLVPGSGFHFQGYVRLCFAVKESVIANSAPAFQAIAREYGLR